MPEPQPISLGNISQGMPLFKTKMMAVRAARSSMRGLPPLGFGGSSGNSGSITSHSSSVTSSLAIPSPYPLPGFVRRTKELAHHLHLGGGFLKSRQELSHPMQPSEDHDHQSLHKELLRVEGRLSTATPQWRWRTRNALDKDNQLDKDTLLSDHGWASGSSVHGHTPSSEASRSGASSDEVLYYL